MWLTAAVILLASAALGAHRLDEPPWEASHHGFHMAEYPHNAVNYLRHGTLRTRLGLAMDYGSGTPTDELRYRVDHPFVLPLAISWSYRLFGVHAWSARLVPLLFALGLSVWTALLGYRLTGQRWFAVLVLAGTALSPLMLYYARLPAPHNIAVFFCVVAFERYWAWYRKPRKLHLATMALALVLGTWSDWIGFFAFPAIVLHHLVFAAGRRSAAFAVAMMAAPFLLFGGYLAWIYSLQADAALETMTDVFLMRTGVSGAGYPRQLASAALAFFGLGARWFTAPVALLAGLWLAVTARSACRRSCTAEDGLVLCLLALAIAHNTFLVNCALDHDFAMFWQLLPFSGLAIALALRWLWRWAETRRVVFIACAVAAGLVFALQAADAYLTGHERGTPYIAEVIAGREIRRALSPTEAYIDAALLDRGLAGSRAHVAADRALTRVSDLDGLLAVTGIGAPSLAVVANSTRSDAALRRYLVEHHPRQDVLGFSLFDLRQDGSSVLPGGSHPEGDDIQRFGAFEHLGVQTTPPAHRTGRPPGAFQSYLDANADLAPGVETWLQVTHLWRKREPGGGDARLRTWIVDATGTYVLQNPHEGLDTLYPTSWWPQDQVVVETFRVLVPAGYPSGEYTVRVAVQPPGAAAAGPDAGIAVDRVTIE